MKILVATKNPAKIEGAKRAFLRFWQEGVEFEGVDVSSDVSDQPVNNEIREGACNREKNLKAYANQNGISADYYVKVSISTISSARHSRI